jgi:hypothetical protein
MVLTRVLPFQGSLKISYLEVDQPEQLADMSGVQGCLRFQCSV